MVSLLSRASSYGPFEVIRPAASGGTASVFIARDRSTERLVALKVLEETGDPKRFDREARILATIVHPNVVRYVAHGIAQSGRPWLAMEWLEGEDLDARLDRAPLSIEQTLHVARGIAEVLAYAHSRRLVHRDLKPGNVFLVDRDPSQLRVLDFGIATDFTESGITKTGTIIGTAQYMAPEQALDVRTVDARTDVFALGAILYHCLTGQPPYRGASLRELLAYVVQAKARPIREVAPSVPAELAALVTRMMARNPDHRPADGGALIHELLEARRLVGRDDERKEERDEHERGSSLAGDRSLEMHA